MIEPSKDDKRDGASPVPGTELDPSPNFVAILQEMLEAGMVGAILESRKTYFAWFARLEGEAADDVARIFSSLPPL